MGKKRQHAETRDGFEKPSEKKEWKGTPKGANNIPVAVREKKEIKKKNSESGKKKANLLFNPQPEWHAVELPQLPSVESPTIPARHILDAIHEYADELLEAEAKEYTETYKSADSSHKFMSTIMASGTMEDKVSALTLLVQESPLHTQKAFGELLGLSRKKSRNAALLALGALKDLLGQGVLLPPDRKLKAFARQPALISALQGKSATWKYGDKLPGSVQKIHLIVWAYEDWLKKQYFEMLKILEGWCNDEVQYSRSRAVTFVWELLKEKPEQEENLLRLLVNKLGDTEKKIASRASYLLLQLEVTHPLMKNVIINALESDLLFRPNQSAHAKYYAIITLNQTVLSLKEQDVASKLLEIYFSLFVSLLKKEHTKEGEEKKEEKRLNKHGHLQGGGAPPGKMARKKAAAEATKEYKSEDEMREKMIAQILTGVNRAFPFAKTDDEKFEKQLDTVFHVTHSSNFNTSIQALMLIQQISAAKHYSTDRYYRTLYESLLDPRLITSSKHIMYLNLLYRSLKNDVSIKRVKAFVKRLLQIIHLHEPPFICGVLYLINELMGSFPNHDTDSEEEHFEDVPEDGAAFTKTEKPKRSRYDPRKRDPDHAAADLSCLWELLPLEAHYHPSVHVLASKILRSEPIKEKPDPTIYTLMNFLDKFAFRNPKVKSTTHGTSIMQPMAGNVNTGAYLIKDRVGVKRDDPINSEGFWRKKADQVPVDEVFFHAYFEKAGKAKQAGKKDKKKKKKEEEESDEEESGEDEIWKALVKSRPEVEGGDEDDDDEGFSDFDMDDMSDDDEDDGADGGVELNLDSDDEDMGREDAAADESDEAMDDGFDLDADAEAFLGSDEDIPVDFDMDEDEEDASEDETTASSKKKEREERKKKKRKLKHLPTFASAEDYAKLLGGDDDTE
ncbi:CBF-domain-containing protein [Delitschia confertaspora ATCC 74209]|uniref:CBF-domain-containing protein n=1 Tax=Delitschia confertaspora ATCC 74209 TaxID=1513339 RepID=A0A9P4JTH1_9PLEO|nr:CBF-domain-containing protein [Delitschia confertaspora ATCC 74209]